MEIYMHNCRVIMPREQGDVESVCRKLWNSNFDDTDKYMDYYFSSRWHESITIVSDNVSMLHLNPYNFKFYGKDIKIYYIVGVCTDKEYRKCGRMDALLKIAFELMYSEGMSFTYLMPASEKIYEPYDFTGIYPVKRWTGSIDALINMVKDGDGNSDKNIVNIPYSQLDKQKTDILCDYADMILAENFSLYVVHNREYFDELEREVKACNGDIVTFWNELNGECIGYIVYMSEDNLEVAESVFDITIRKYVAEYLSEYIDHNTLPEEIILYETYFWNIDCEVYEKNYLMARIIDIRSFIPQLRSDIKNEMWVDVTDGIIKGNSGRWHIVIDKDSSFIEQIEEKINQGEGTDAYADNVDNRNIYDLYAAWQDENDDKKDNRDMGHVKWETCTITELGNRLFKNIRYYMNELV